MVPLLPLLSLLACSRAEPEPGPLGIPMVEDGVIYAGIARVDVTPELGETFTDSNGNANFDGCYDDPTGVSCNGEPWDDADGDGVFEPVWIAGFGPERPAQSVHDPITVTALVIAVDGQYLAMVAGDFVGVHSPRIDAARARLAETGFDGDRFVFSSSHNHQGPDTFGIWGNPFNLANPVSGLNPDYMDRIEEAMVTSVTEAAGAMVPVTLRIGETWMRDESPYFNGEKFGGHNPVAKVHGLINDGRDPVVVSDRLLVLQGNTPEGSTVFTLTNWSGHPETWDSNNTAISADYVGKARSELEAHYGGMGIHFPEALGGMQSALGAGMPRADETTGAMIMDLCDATEISDAVEGCEGASEGDPRTYADGTPRPEWAEQDTWDFVQSHGWHIANAAIGALEAGEDITEAPITHHSETYYIPLENGLYQLILPLGLTELGEDDTTGDPAKCPDVALSGSTGCIPVRTSRITLGPLGILTVPGELLPEVGRGLPDDPVFLAESEDLTKRGTPESTYFLQHRRECDDKAWEGECQDNAKVGDCDCLRMHAVPFRLSDDPDTVPLYDLLDTKYKTAFGMSDHYLSYIVPTPDFHLDVSYLDEVGDHYEDSVSPTSVLGQRTLEAQARLAERAAAE